MKHTQAVNAIASSSHAILKDVLKSDDIKKYYEVANSVRSLIQWLVDSLKFDIIICLFVCL